MSSSVCPSLCPVGLGKPFVEVLKSIFHTLSTSPILDLVTANDRYENAPEGFFSWLNTRGFKTNSVEKLEFLFNQKTDFRSCGVVR